MQKQDSLFDKDNTPRIDKSLIAFAFLAQASSGSDDILSGITPIFKPIAKNKAGQVFSAAEFSTIVSNLYGISIHPWAIDELAPRLENAGILNKVMISEKVAEYYYGEITEDFNEVDESDIQLIVKRFTDFAQPILESNKLPFDEKALEVAFFEQLISMDFVSILRKPDRSKEDKYNKETIRSKKTPEQTEWENNTEAKSKIEVLCASFILDVYKNERSLYDLLVKISNGAFVAEAVLNFRAPEGVSDLNQLRVILDAPFMMSLLDLGAEETHRYAKALGESLTSHGARLYAFQHSCEEIKDNLKGVISAFEKRESFGSTARRLNDPTFKAYATSIKNNPEAALKKIGIDLIKPLDKAATFQYFTQQDEDDFSTSLGLYFNSVAQLRDAESVAYIMRLRRGKQIKMINFTKAEFIFITENQTLANKATKFLERRNVVEQGFVPVAMTDRFLAGLLLVLYGGSIDNFTHRRLIANCSAALETRSDVIRKVTDFLTKVEPQQADRFRAMMTEERAGQCLMQLSLGDPLLINDNNIPKILDEVKKSLIEDHRKESEKEKQELENAHQNELEAKNKSLTNANQLVIDAEARILIANQSIKSISDESMRTKNDLLKEKQKNLEDDRKRIEKSVRASAMIYLIVKILLGIAIALGIAYIAYLKTLHSNNAVNLIIIIAAGIFGFLGYIKLTEWMQEKIQSYIRKNILNALMTIFVTTYDLSYFKINWELNTVDSLPKKLLL